ncbi:hypothetical protein IAQ61_004544 [Plenodomus lingam]|uniref:uncharacterized protein n=1 Tax=Leptosphaeria maculans TaxID=5022 RepID=UPI00333078D7|nr:hypothetical protein IAQ61_004544 [Plenodomus lingam]
MDKHRFRLSSSVPMNACPGTPATLLLLFYYQALQLASAHDACGSSLNAHQLTNTRPGLGCVVIKDAIESSLPDLHRLFNAIHPTCPSCRPPRSPAGRLPTVSM